MIEWTPGLTLADVEKIVILKAFKFFQGNKTRTAGALDIAIRTLDAKLEQYGMKASSHGVISYELPTTKGLPDAAISTEKIVIQAIDIGANSENGKKKKGQPQMDADTGISGIRSK